MYEKFHSLSSLILNLLIVDLLCKATIYFFFNFYFLQLLFILFLIKLISFGLILKIFNSVGFDLFMFCTP